MSYCLLFDKYLFSLSCLATPAMLFGVNQNSARHEGSKKNLQTMGTHSKIPRGVSLLRLGWSSVLAALMYEVGMRPENTNATEHGVVDSHCSLPTVRSKCHTATDQNGPKCQRRPRHEKDLGCSPLNCGEALLLSHKHSSRSPGSIPLMEGALQG